MKNPSFINRHFLFRKLLPKDWEKGQIPWQLLAFVLMVSALPYVGAFLDGVLTMEGEKMGLLESYGAVAFTIVFPLLLLLCLKGVRHFDHFISQVENRVIPEKFAEEMPLEEFLQKYYRQDYYGIIKYLAILLGLAYVLAMAIYPFLDDASLHHMTYDSGHNIFTYGAERIFALVWHGYILPILLYRLVLIIIVLHKFFKLVKKTDSLNLQPLHPDNAGGFGELGNMSLDFTFAVLLTMFLPLAMYYNYGLTSDFMAFRMGLSLGLQFLLLPVVFFLPLFPAHRVMKAKKEEILTNVSRHYNHIVMGTLIEKLKGTSEDFYQSQEEAKKEFEMEKKLSSFNASFEDISTWPFDVSTIMQFLGTILLPVVVTLLEMMR